MLQCEKLMSMELAERREVLEKSGLCMFCLKHAAELERYGRGGLSKPRCAQPGCDGEHTPGVHKLMGEGSAGVNLITEGESEEEGEDRGEDEDREEDEDEGWWVGTVGVMETPDWTGEASHVAPGLGLAQGADQGEVEGDSQIECEHDFQVNECPEGEMTEDEWWELEPAYPGLERGGGRRLAP
jgi:hypothetical protein